MALTISAIHGFPLRCSMIMTFGLEVRRGTVCRNVPYAKSLLVPLLRIIKKNTRWGACGFQPNGIIAIYLLITATIPQCTWQPSCKKLYFGKDLHMQKFRLYMMMVNHVSILITYWTIWKTH